MKHFITFALICLALVVYGCGDKIKPGTKEIARPAITGVKTAKITINTVNDVYEISGTVKAENIAVLSSKVMGRIRSIAVKEGDIVKAGQTLLSIEAGEFANKSAQASAGVAEAQAALNMAEENKLITNTTYERFKNLYEEKVISKQEFNEIDSKRKIADLSYTQAEAAYRRARSALSEAHVFQGYTTITAPFNGIVGEKMVDAGAMAAPGVPLITVEDASSYNVIINVDEGIVADIKKGTQVDISLDTPALKTKGTITEVSQYIDPAARTFSVKIAIAEDVPKSGLKSGLYAVASIKGSPRQTLNVPETAVVEKGQLRGVYVVDENGVVTYRLITTGRKFPATVTLEVPSGVTLEVLSGVTDGEVVITGGTAVDGGQITGYKPDYKPGSN
ncbi:MAG: efflux RND transporter periplasmic adaptor subunit [Nitrospirae bacterium]|nr:efflux RND transporter periplasmic adaptor subunit [Nitrospirota bacterium]